MDKRATYRKVIVGCSVAGAATIGTGVTAAAAGVAKVSGRPVGPVVRTVAPAATILGASVGAAAGVAVAAMIELGN